MNQNLEDANMPYEEIPIHEQTGTNGCSKDILDTNNALSNGLNLSEDALVFQQIAFYYEQQLDELGGQQDHLTDAISNMRNIVDSIEKQIGAINDTLGINDETSILESTLQQQGEIRNQIERLGTSLINVIKQESENMAQFMITALEQLTARVEEQSRDSQVLVQSTTQKKENLEIASTKYEESNMNIEDLYKEIMLAGNELKKHNETFLEMKEAIKEQSQQLIEILTESNQKREQKKATRQLPLHQKIYRGNM
ncbi:hypothetical protein IMZ31_01730 [Pontibacillus sp. ALD_SL1]|uniref:hypothetical protein n=1 Tax=Pontibacillus sp. ALD_SL1 TaxID=2777185 RepID=UPI001A97C727|nr:hypothetical protein [Pontibacillus sp. ALD_SL1]QST00346.1 hypothetical protein IMZ31_01730 [Pontibacillus sp. ALD_SL1]